MNEVSGFIVGTSVKILERARQRETTQYITTQLDQPRLNIAQARAHENVYVEKEEVKSLQ